MIINMSVGKSISKEVKEFRRHLSSKSLDLLAAGFGLVAALAWNEAIKETVNVYIKPFFGDSSGVITLYIYAVFVTLLTVFIVYNIGKLKKK